MTICLSDSNITHELSTHKGPSGAQDIEMRFLELELVWKQETSKLSSIREIIDHPAYQEIIQMGSRAVPLILLSLRRDPDHWFEALGRITNENPVAPADAGNIDRMATAWLQWGVTHGLTEETKSSCGM